MTESAVAMRSFVHCSREARASKMKRVPIDVPKGRERLNDASMAVIVTVVSCGRRSLVEGQPTAAVAA